MNFGIIGFGAIGDIHAKVIENSKEAKLTAIAARTEENARKAGEKYGCAYYTDYHEMLKRRDIDIVSICLPSGMHYEAAMAAAQAGKHCIVEKPLEVSTARIERMIDTFDKKGLQLSVIFQHRFDQSTQLIKQAIAGDTMGKLNYGTCRTNWFRDESYYQDSAWRGTWAGDGGGALMNQAIHSIDLLLYLMGPVEAVCGKCDTLYHQSIETEDVGAALLRFRNGALGVIEGTTLAYPGFHSELNIYGQSGSAGIRDHELDYYHFKTGKQDAFENLLRKGDENIPYGWYNLIPHMRQFEDMMDAVKTNRQPLVNGREGLKAVQLINAIYESSRKNEWVLLP